MGCNSGPCSRHTTRIPFSLSRLQTAAPAIPAPMKNVAGTSRGRLLACFHG
jgi:hypothetical protein